MTRFFALGFVLMMGAGALAGCSDFCTQAECTSGVVTEVAVPADQIAGAKVTFCRSGHCSHATVEKDPGGAVFCDVVGFNCTPIGEGSSFALQIRLLVSDPSLPDDEEVEVTVESADGETVLAHVTGNVEYEVLSPNGEDCGPTCYSAEL